VPSCAGAYVSGAAGSNACPAGSVRIETEAACRTAAAAAGKDADPSYFAGTFPNVPRGCYYVTSTNDAFFNPHAVGAGTSTSQLLCAVTTGAPPPANASEGTPARAVVVRMYSPCTTELASCQQNSFGLERPHARDAAGTERQCWAHSEYGWFGIAVYIGFSPRTHGVLTAYSWVLTGCRTGSAPVRVLREVWVRTCHAASAAQRTTACVALSGVPHRGTY
jgi:hypothetical protein